MTEISTTQAYRALGMKRTAVAMLAQRYKLGRIVYCKGRPVRVFTRQEVDFMAERKGKRFVPIHDRE